MTPAIDEDFKAKLSRIRRRKWWPVSELAGILGRPKKYVYRRITDKTFRILPEGCFMKVTSRSVLKFYSGKSRNTAAARKEPLVRQSAGASDGER